MDAAARVLAILHLFPGPLSANILTYSDVLRVGGTVSQISLTHTPSGIKWTPGGANRCKIANTLAATWDGIKMCHYDTLITTR